MRHLWSFLLLLCLLLPHKTAHAEAATLTTYVGGPFNIYYNEPNLADYGFRIDCGPTQKNCFLLNQAACADDATELPISFTISRGQGSGLSNDASTSRTVYAFLSTTSSCIFSQLDGQIGNNANYLIGTTPALPAGSIFFSGGTRPFVFPRDLTTFNAATTQAGTTGKFTTGEMLRALGLCSNANGTNTNLSTYFLCVGVDSSNKGGVNNGTTAVASTSTTSSSLTGTPTASTGDPTAYLQLQADTQPPATPTGLTVLPRNGRVEATVTYDTTALDVYQVTLAYTHDATNIAAGAVPDGNGVALGCAAWQGNVLRVSINVRNQVSGSQDFEVDGLENNVTYAFCASSADLLGNTSGATATQTALPRFECDLFDCYPGPLRTGYCGAGSTSELWLGAGSGAALLAAARRRRRRALHRCMQQRSALTWLGALWVAMALVATPGSARADEEDRDGVGNRPRSESPIQTMRSRPQDGESEAPNQVPLSHGKPQATGFGDPDQEGLSYAPFRPKPPRWGAEFRLAPYRPRIGGPAVRQVYNLIYGNHDHAIFPGRPLSYTVGFEWFFWRRWGLGGPVARLGYWQASGATRQCQDAAGAPTRCTAQTVLTSQKGNDVATLMLIPLSLGVIWRADPLLAQLHVPMGAALTAGLDYIFWRASSGGRPARYGGHLARGGVLGLHLGAQLSLQLDALFHSSNTRSRALAGTHLFVDYQYSYGAALVGAQRRNRLDTTSQHLVGLGLGLRFF